MRRLEVLEEPTGELHQEVLRRVRLNFRRRVAFEMRTVADAGAIRRACVALKAARPEDVDWQVSNRRALAAQAALRGVVLQAVDARELR